MAQPRGRVLVVEDDPVLAELTTSALAAVTSRRELRIVPTAEAFLDLWPTWDPDVTLLDLHLPGIGGLAALRAARDAGYEGKVIVVTGKGSEETAAEALRLGASDYLAKGANFVWTVPRAVEDAFSRLELERQNRELQAQNARAIEVERRRLALMRALQQVSTQISAELDTGAVLGSVLEHALEMFGARRAGILLAGSEGDVLVPAASRGFSAEYLVGLAGQESLRLSRLQADARAPSRLRRGAAGAVAVEAATGAAPVWDDAPLLLPLMHGQRVIGAILLHLPDEAEFGEVELEVAKALANQAAIAIENARMYESARRREEETARLSDLSRALDARASVSELLDNLAARTSDLVGATCIILLADDQTGGYQLAAVSGLGTALQPVAELVQRLCGSLASGPLSEITRRRSPAMVVDERALVSPASPGRAPVLPPCSLVVIPLLAKSGPLAIMAVISSGGTYRVLSAVDVALVRAVVDRATAALENAWLFQQVVQAKKTWEETFDAITDGIFIHDVSFRIVRANRAFARMLGEPVEALIGRSCRSLTEEQGTLCPGCTTRVDSEAELAQREEVVENHFGPVYVQISSYPLRDQSGGVAATVHVAKDVTEQRQMQEAMVRSEKLRALGEMATGVAHDFNNILASILGRTELALLDRTESPEYQALLDIHQAALDGAATVKRIQEYSRIRRDADFQRIDVTEVVRGALNLTRPKWRDGPQKAGIAVRLDVDMGEIPPVLGSASDLREVLMNLIFNAVDAMPGGGVLTIRGWTEGDQAVLAVSDSGVGMSDDVLRRCFDPFFSTKGEAGNGLGLSVAYGILSRHGGEIVVESSPGAGSTFSARLPLALGAGAESAPAEEPWISQPLRLLAVDDEPHVLRGLQTLLARDGHAVDAFARVADALDRLKQHRYDVVFTDLGMPEMNGWDVARRVREVQPEAAVVLITGWEGELDRRESLAKVDGIVPKPYTLADLRRALRTVLTARAVRGLSVLVVDDQRSFAESLAARLELEGHGTEVALTGRAGLDALGSRAFDLVFCDLRLPDASGLDLAGVARAGGAYFVLMSGLALDAQDPAYTAAGVDAVLPKPWKAHELELVLQAAVLPASRAAERLPAEPRPA